MQKFTAKLVKESEQGAWTIVHVPFDVEAIFGKSGYIKVKGTIDNYAFSGIKLMPMGNGSYCLAIKEAIRKAINKENGDNVQVTMEPDTSQLVIPKKLSEGLSAYPQAKAFFDGLTESNQNYFVEWVASAKREETQDTRVVKSIEKLLAGKKFHK